MAPKAFWALSGTTISTVAAVMTGSGAKTAMMCCKAGQIGIDVDGIDSCAQLMAKAR